MECPNCQSRNFSNEALIVSSNSDGDTNWRHQWWKCTDCSSVFYGCYTEFRDGSGRHEGYRAELNEWQDSLKLAQKCPNPGNTDCNCHMHSLTAAHVAAYRQQVWYTTDDNDW